MTEKSIQAAAPKPAAALEPAAPAKGRAPAEAGADEAERRLGRAIAFGLPLATLGAAIVVGVVVSVGPAFLVLAGGALVGTVALLWASLRTLGGDAPLPQDLELISRSDRFSEAEERKRAVLRALKDLEHERAIGKIDDEDYESIAAHYRDQAKAILRELDAEVAPYRAKAEDLVRKHLAKRGLESAAASAAGQEAEPEAESLREAEALREPEALRESDSGAEAPVRIACSKCATSNEPDASFCKKCGNALQEAAHAEV
ncbi:zinc ribbon domain-containing protein [Pendulispora albinea]|uniref:Zinc ribbon domain-containing protein n=1 Tax=Pendulispora albinea TaxID=2741071 RepID=A0ABZ2LVC1_9BACT